MAPLALFVLALSAEHFVMAIRVGESDDPATIARFHEFVAAHDRNYSVDSDEYALRLGRFSRRLAVIDQHNSQPVRLWTAGINFLSDWTDDEFSSLLGWRGVASSSPGHGARSSLRGPVQLLGHSNGTGSALPEEFLKWMHLNTAKHPRSQGHCGSCWAVTAATVLDMHSEIHYPEDNRKFSARELLSCVPNPRNCGGRGGCHGATVELAFDWVMQHGLSREEQVPYVPKEGLCEKTGEQVYRSKSSNLRQRGRQELPGMLELGMRSWQKLPENQYLPLLRAVVDHGPVAVSVAAREWHSYSHGIFDGCRRDAVISHAVTLVGFGSDKELGAKYYGVQNTWGESWGEHGHIRLLRRDDDASARCGVDRQPEKGTACDGGPSEVEVCGMCGVLYDSVVPLFTPL